MKPEHFIYKSDGLYYMQNVPEYPAVANQFDPHDSVYFADVYTKALERAKEDAVPFNDYFLGLKRILHSMNISCGEGNEELVRISKLNLKEGQFYTINIEEKIEVVKTDDIKCTHCVHDCYRSGVTKCGTYARIVAPKKEEESAITPWRDVYYQISGMLKAGKNVYEITEALQSGFEIKRKPL